MNFKPELIAGIFENAKERDFELGQLIIQEGDSVRGNIYNN